MIYVLFNDGEPVHVTSESPYTGTPALKEFPGIVYTEAKTTGDFDSFEEVTSVAAKLTVLTGETWLPFDNGPSTSHQFGVIQPPKVGDFVSYGFNGDYYPCGKVIRITPGWRIYALDETKPTGARRRETMFNRRKQTSQWVMKGGTWSLVQGIVDERNPHF